MQDFKQRLLGDGVLHEELEHCGDLVAVDQAVFVVLLDDDLWGFDADVLGGDLQHVGQGVGEIGADERHDRIAVDPIHPLGFGSSVGGVLTGEGVDAEARDLFLKCF